jgi:hypothetical protein
LIGGGMDTILETIQNFEQRIAEAHNSLNIANEQLNQLMTPQKRTATLKMYFATSPF